MKKEPKPRRCCYFGMHCPAQFHARGTWMEAEEMTYPHGHMVRRARVINTETGKLVVVRCGIADTFFSIPVRGGGWVGMNTAVDGDEYLEYHPPIKTKEKTNGKN